MHVGNRIPTYRLLLGQVELQFKEQMGIFVERKHENDFIYFDDILGTFTKALLGNPLLVFYRNLIRRWL